MEQTASKIRKKYQVRPTKFNKSQMKRRYYLHAEIARYREQHQNLPVQVDAEKWTIQVRDFDFANELHPTIARYCMELQQVYGYNIQRSLIFTEPISVDNENNEQSLIFKNTIPMADEQTKLPSGKTMRHGKVSFNLPITPKAFNDFSESYQDYVKHGLDHGYGKVKAGEFAEKVLMAGLKVMTKKEYFGEEK